MNEPADNGLDHGDDTRRQPLRMLTARQVLQIDHLLEQVSPFGELHLVVRDGKLRFLTKIESRDALVGVPKRECRSGAKS